MAIVRFFIYSNLWLALCASALCLCSELILEDTNLKVTTFVFFATLFSYNFQALLSLKTSIANNKKKWIQDNLNLVYFLLFSSIAIAAYISFDFNSKTLFLTGILCFISLFYSFGLRSIPFIKIFLISISWTIGTVLLFIFESETTQFDPKALGVVIGRIFFVFALVIPFDIRDLQYDSKRLKTIPQIFGYHKARLIAILFLFAYFLITLLQYIYYQIDFNIFLAILICCLISSALIYQANTKKPIFFFSFWIEGLSALLFIVLLLANRFLC